METDLFIPIQSDTAAQSIKVISPRAAGLDVRVKGSVQAIQALPQHLLRYPLQISSSGGGVQTIPVEAERIELPKGILIVNIQPQMITVHIEQRIEKRLPVEVVLTGTPATGYVVANTIVKPDWVRVVGPGSVLAKMARIPIKPVAITGMSAVLKKHVVLDLPDDVEPAKPEPVMIEVTFKKRTMVKTLRGIRIKSKGDEKPYKISPPTIDLTIEGPDQIIGNLTTNPQFDVYVDLTGLDSGIFVRRAVILLPLNTTLIKATPEVFTVHIGSANKQGG